MKRDYKKIWWDKTFIKRLYQDREKPVTVKQGFMFMGILLAVFIAVVVAGRVYFG